MHAGILDQAIREREAVLQQVERVCEESSGRSDFGWFLTLGSEPLGMLMAVEAGIEARRLGQLAAHLRRELDYLYQRRREAILA